MLGRKLIIINLLSMILLLSACGNHTYHVVKPGDTLYSIGWAYGYDYKQIASWNSLDKPYSINNGQIIKLVPPKRNFRRVHSEKSKKNIARVPTKRTRDNANKGSNYSKSQQLARNATPSRKRIRANKDHAKKIVWKWPTISKNIVQYFLASDIRKRGVKIAGRNGESVKAAAAGRVVYSGSGLIGYGRLIIIKHDGVYLSAYAHNRELLAKEGDEIKLGQRIATMGRSGTNRIMLHFEIRRKGVPVDPLDFLPRRG